MLKVTKQKQADSSLFLYASLGLISLTLLSGLILSSALVSADDSVVDQVVITVPVSCTLSGTGMNSHTAEISNGTYTPNIGTTTLHAFCNDNNGFAIYAAGYTGNEIGGTNSNKLVGTSASSNATIDTGLATSAGNPDVSNWAMKLAITQDSGDTTGTNAYTIDSAPNTSGGADASFSQYHVVPNEYTKVAHKNSATDMTATTGGVKLTTTYAAYISKTQPADTYTGQVIYTLVHPANHAAPVACNPTGTTISTIQCMQDFASLSSIGRISVLNSMTPEQQYTLKDSRDGKSYTIAKYPVSGELDWTEYYLAEDYIDSCEGGECDSSLYDELSSDWQDFVDSCNGSWDNWDDEAAEALLPPFYNVWMTQNLDLDLDSGTTYTNLDTDLYWNTSWTPSRSTYTTTINNTHAWCQGGTWNSQDGYCEQNNTPESYDPGNLYWNTATTDNSWSDWNSYYNSCDQTTSTPSCDESLNPLSAYVSSTGIAQYHLGNYYNWTAAIAMNDSSSVANESVDQSICPAGWTLPYYDFEGLWIEYGWTSRDYFDDISTIWSAPLYLAPTGVFYGRVGDVGGSGAFWSSIAYSNNNAYEAFFGVNGHTNPSYWVYRSNGISVRCILR